MNNTSKIINENLSDKLKRQTIIKTFNERAEFIIIGLTGSNGGIIRNMTECFSKTYSYDELDTLKKYLSNIDSNNVCKKNEYDHICEYAKYNWKKFDIIKARDVIITYILENAESFGYFIEDLKKTNPREDFNSFLENKTAEKEVYELILKKREELEEEIKEGQETYQIDINEYKTKIEMELDEFENSNKNGRTMLDRIKELNDKLGDFIGSLKEKKAVMVYSDDMSLYVYTKYILPSVGQYIKEILGDNYIEIFQRYGNEIRFFGTLDRSKWKNVLVDVENGGKFDNFYSLVKRINTFIKIRRAPIFSEKSVPVRIVIDSLKNPYEFSFLKDRYSAYYTFGMLDNSDDKNVYGDERYDKKYYTKLYEQPEQIKNGFRKFVNVLLNAFDRNINIPGYKVDYKVVNYIKSLSSASEYINYLYDKLDIYMNNGNKGWNREDICPDLDNIRYDSYFEKEGILNNEFNFYISILKNPIRVYCLLSNLYSIYLQDIQNSIQNADVLLKHNNCELTRDRESYNRLKYNIIKYVSLIMHPGFVPPTNIEKCMQIAFNVKVNSGCISRKVGAVVTDKEYNILSVGWNDVHAKSKVPCIYRSIDDFKQEAENKKTDPKNKCVTYSDYELDSVGSFYKEMNGYDISETDRKEIMCGVPSCYCFKTIYNRIEHKNNPIHSRAIHGEAKAFIDSDREKAMGGYLFTTSSSCENCTMLANDYGIKKIYYIEKYPGIAMNHVNATGREEDRAEFILFSGVIGEAYTKLYTPIIPLKDELELRGIERLYGQK